MEKARRQGPGRYEHKGLHGASAPGRQTTRGESLGTSGAFCGVRVCDDGEVTE